jgi:hypothetical protein
MNDDVWHWTIGDADYFLIADPCDYECYSLFRGGVNYGRIITFCMSREDALKASPQMIQQDRHSLNGSKQ